MSLPADVSPMATFRTVLRKAGCPLPTTRIDAAFRSLPLWQRLVASAASASVVLWLPRLAPRPSLARSVLTVALILGLFAALSVLFAALGE